jgi:hypothetical protein
MAGGYWWPVEASLVELRCGLARTSPHVERQVLLPGRRDRIYLGDRAADE